MNNNPLVSVICLCYNQAAFLKESLESVWNQTYENIQLIVVDDCSTDQSIQEIEKLLVDKDVLFIKLETNIGNTSAFNRGLKFVKGDYVIDLAADDVLDKDRIKKQVAFFNTCSDKVGVIYSDAMYISESRQMQSRHFSNKKLRPHQGDIYKELIGKYFIPTPTMMIRKSVFDELNGYDPHLAYEDFDFWIRSSRNWEYAFQDEILTYIRKVKGSFSTKAYTLNNNQVHSTYLVCKKIYELNSSESEQTALRKRLSYEIRQASFSGNQNEAKRFFGILKEMNGGGMGINSLMLLNKLNINFSVIRNLYHKLMY